MLTDRFQPVCQRGWMLADLARAIVLGGKAIGDIATLEHRRSPL
ncbi:hypothetical protein [Streptomyces oryzae]|nr:hypothetical protein [Streptomyces oryzae]